MHSVDIKARADKPLHCISVITGHCSGGPPTGATRSIDQS
jgi:hypothetical protein